MRKSIVSLVIVLAANVSLAWGQTTEELPTLPISLFPQPSLPGFNDVPQPREVPSVPRVLPSPVPPLETSPEEAPHGGMPEIGEAGEEPEERKTPQRFWVRGEYLLWFIKDANLPVLVTSGAFTDPRPGAIGSPNTSVLFGGGSEDYLNRSGARFFTGYWLDDERRLGLEVGYFFIAGISAGQNFSSPGSPVLARPFFNAATGQQDSSIVAYPGVTNGNVLVTTGSFLQGAEMNLTSTLFEKPEKYRIEGLVGFRYLNLNESVQIGENDQLALSPEYMPPLYTGPPISKYVGDSIAVIDSFTTRNDFFGGQFGFRAEYQYKRLSLEVLTKVALGCSNEVVNIHGSTSINTTPATNYNAGLLAVGSNSGQYTRDAFSVVPEVGLNLGFQLTNNLKIFGGYSLLYWTNVVRPGDQIDTTVNPNQVPTSPTYGMAGGPARPAFVFHANDFFAQGANFGMEFRY